MLRVSWEPIFLEPLSSEPRPGYAQNAKLEKANKFLVQAWSERHHRVALRGSTLSEALGKFSIRKLRLGMIFVIMNSLLANRWSNLSGWSPCKRDQHTFKTTLPRWICSLFCLSSSWWWPGWWVSVWHVPNIGTSSLLHPLFKNSFSSPRPHSFVLHHQLYLRNLPRSHHPTRTLVAIPLSLSDKYSLTTVANCPSWGENSGSQAAEPEYMPIGLFESWCISKVSLIFMNEE